MRKKPRFFYFFLLTCLIIACPFLFPSFIFPGGKPEHEPPLPPANLDSANGGEGKTEAWDPKNTPAGEKGTAEEPGLNSPGSLPQPEQNDPQPIPAGGSAVPFPWDAAIMDKISFLQCPLPGAHVSSRDSQLPGAPRPYRHGVHEGLDFYSGACGIDVNYGDPVFAAGPGVVYRIDHGYVEPPTEEREEQLRICAETKNTPEDILDALRGRQVWLVHSQGVITRYAHLSKTNADMQVGDLVEAGDFIGNVGNSGTSEGAAGLTAGAHLHLEIWIGDNYLGETLSPAEIRALWKSLLEK